jgi:hypothetical protein
MNKETKVIPADNPNLRIWDELAKTDPNHTSGFKRAGGFSGTAVKPIWIVRRLTEVFGPCGEGWGIGEPKFQVVPGDNREMLVYCTVSCWHSSPENVVYGVGGDKIVTYIKANEKYNRPERWESDDEAFKKAFTDAVGNAFKFVGVAADIHMGLFDDSKYLAEVREEFEEIEQREKLPGISKIKRTLNKLMLDGNNAQDLEKFNELVHNCADDLTKIKDAQHSYWTGDGEDFEGFKAWIVRRRAELSQPVSLTFQLLCSTVGECTSIHELRSWLDEHCDKIAELDGEESRKFSDLYNTKETALNAVEQVTAGA